MSGGMQYIPNSKSANSKSANSKSARKELGEILDYLDFNYQKNLALHLLSTHLIHNKTPRFPERSWSSWPMSITESISEPNMRLYIDEDDPFNELNQNGSNSYFQIPPFKRSEMELQCELNAFYQRIIYNQIFKHNEVLKQRKRKRLGNTEENHINRMKYVKRRRIHQPAAQNDSDEEDNNDSDNNGEVENDIVVPIVSKTPKLQTESINSITDILQKLLENLSKSREYLISNLKDPNPNLNLKPSFSANHIPPFTWEDIIINLFDINPKLAEIVLKRCKQIFPNSDYEYNEEELKNAKRFNLYGRLSTPELQLSNKKDDEQKQQDQEEEKEEKEENIKNENENENEGEGEDFKIRKRIALSDILKNRRVSHLNKLKIIQFKRKCFDIK